MNTWSWRCFSGLLLAFLAQEGFAQSLPVWPRHPTTGRIEFSGVIPWPVPAPGLPQQQALVRRWYLAKLTAEETGQLAKVPARETTFAGLRTRTYLDSVSYHPDYDGAVDSVAGRVIWRLMFKVRLTPTPAGLAYRLSEFECVEMVYDASASEELETVLPRYAAEQAVFYRRLRRALAGW